MFFFGCLFSWTPAGAILKPLWTPLRPPRVAILSRPCRVKINDCLWHTLPEPRLATSSGRGPQRGSKTSQGLHAQSRTCIRLRRYAISHFFFKTDLLKRRRFGSGDPSFPKGGDALKRSISGGGPREGNIGEGIF